jgi:predicted RNA-binding Zn-ribbon protein involved in translation (DUF1610 family)
METVWHKNLPKIEDDGYYLPTVPFCEEGIECNYYKAISKEDFIECFNRWIINTDLPSYEDYLNGENKSRYNKSEPKFKCPKCGGKVRRDETRCLATFPPKHIYECDDCEFNTCIAF